MKLFTIILSLTTGLFLFLAGCSDPAEENPRLAYLVGYSILDARFHTSTRLDLTADILNQTNEDLQMTQLILTDQEGNIFTLDYETIPKMHQEGRYNAIPLKAPIVDMKLGGVPGEEYHSPGDLHFLFHVGFKSAVIRFRNSQGLQEYEVPELPKIIEQSRAETLAWMQKEHEERQKTLETLGEKAQQIIDDRRKK